MIKTSGPASRNEDELELIRHNRLVSFLLSLSQSLTISLSLSLSDHYNACTHADILGGISLIKALENGEIVLTNGRFQDTWFNT